MRGINLSFLPWHLSDFIMCRWREAMTGTNVDWACVVLVITDHLAIWHLQWLVDWRKLPDLLLVGFLEGVFCIVASDWIWIPCFRSCKLHRTFLPFVPEIKATPGARIGGQGFLQRCLWGCCFLEQISWGGTNQVLTLKRCKFCN